MSWDTIDLEAVMAKPKHIDHAELMQLGKTLLLLIERQDIRSNFSSLTETARRTPEVANLSKAS